MQQDKILKFAALRGPLACDSNTAAYDCSIEEYLRLAGTHPILPKGDFGQTSVCTIAKNAGSTLRPAPDSTSLSCLPISAPHHALRHPHHLPGLLLRAPSITASSKAAPSPRAAVEVLTHDLRAFTHDRHRTGRRSSFRRRRGAWCSSRSPSSECVESLGGSYRREDSVRGYWSRESVILLSAQGQPLHPGDRRAPPGKRSTGLFFICRPLRGRGRTSASTICSPTRGYPIGDYVLSGGELAACSGARCDRPPTPRRPRPRADFRALSESFGASDDPARRDGYSRRCTPLYPRRRRPSRLSPHYTRPAEFRGIGSPPTGSRRR